MNATAQDTTKADPANKAVLLNETVISANKSEEKKSDIPYTIEIIKAKDVEMMNPQTSADMLESTGAVFVQKSQMGAGSAVLRGFEANKVLMVVDGVRMNNAIYRGGHLQDVITIDNSMLDHTEIIFGPSSVMYGSDALGGVMHFFTKKPVFANDTMVAKANTFVRWSSANNEKTGHFDLNLGWKKIASLTSFTYSDFDDLRAGNNRDPVYDQAWTRDFYAQYIGNGKDSMMKNSDRNVQKFTGYSQYDLHQKFAIVQSENITHTVNVQYSNSSNIPRYDRLTDPGSGGNLKFAEWYYGPQERMLASAKTSVQSSSKLFNKMEVTLAYQKIGQERISRKFNNTIKKFQMENVTVYSLNADFMKQLNEKNVLHYGAEATHNDVQSNAYAIDILSTIETPADTRYPDGGSTMSSAAGYLTHRFNVSKKIILSEGVRFSASWLSSEFIDTTFFPFPFKNIKQNTTAVTGNIGIVIKPTHSWRISLVGSTGFRTPNVDDIGKVFDSSPVKRTLIVPNPNLKPETAYNGELGIEKTFMESVRMNIAGWYTLLTNAIVVKNFRLNGADSVMYAGTMSKVQAPQNADDAYIYGISGTFIADFNKYFSFKSTATYTYGRARDKANDSIVPLDHIPPLFGQTSLMFKSKKINAEVYVRYNGWKELKNYSSGGEDNLEYATVFGMPAWTTINAMVSYKPTKNISLNVGMENITDIHYRHFASGVSAPGRNLIVTVRGKF